MGLHIWPCPEMRAVLNTAKTLSAFWRGVFVGYKLAVFPSAFLHHRSAHAHFTQLYIQTIYRT